MKVDEETIDATLDVNGQLQLEHPTQVQPGPVKVTIRTVAATRPKPGLADVIRQIRADQLARGFQGLTSEELQRLEADAAAEDEAYDREMEQARALPPV